MSLPDGADPARVVVEVADLSHATPPWRWFEIDLDHLDGRALCRDLPPALSAKCQVSGRTRHHDPGLVARHLTRPRTQDLTHLQVEAHRRGPARRAVARITAAGLIPLPATHLPTPPASSDDLRRAVALLAELGAPLIKIAYPAPNPALIDAGLRVLEEFAVPGVDLALIPMGTRTGRNAAYAAGSRLMWVPPHADAERWGADQLRIAAAAHHPPSA